MPPGSLPAAVLWDMDGTLVDSEHHYIAVQRGLVERFGGTWSDEQSLGLVGLGLHDAARGLQDAGVALSAPDIVATMTDGVAARIRGAEEWRPGAVELLRAVREAGVPTALVTMSVRRLAEAVVAALPFPAFDAVVTLDDVVRPKPFPDPYERAAELLGVPIAECVAIEDSPTGLRAAVAAGAVVVGVPHFAALPDGAGWTRWPTLQGRGVDDLAALVAARRAGSPA